MTEQKLSLQEQVREYIRQKGMTQVGFARAAGIGESTMSRFINGKLDPAKTDSAQTEAKIRDFLEKEIVRETITETKDIEFVMTTNSEKIWGALEYGRIQRTISVIYGDAGVGKTYTMKNWAADKTDIIIVTASPAFKSNKAFCKLLAKQLKTTTSGAVDDIVLDIMDKLENSDRTIVIDEAQHLTRPTLEQIRSISEATNTGIILMGNEVVYSKMLGKQEAEFAQLFTRIGMRKPILTDYFTENDVKEIFSMTDPAVVSYLLSICRSKFSLRAAIHVFVNAQNNEDTSLKGLKAMSKAMGIVV